MPTPARPPTPDEIRTARKRLHLTQAAFGMLLGIARQETISDWERGRVTPSISTLHLEQVLAAHQPSPTGGHVLDPRSYALGAFASLSDDVRLIAEVAARMAVKVDAASATLGGTSPPLAVPDSSIAEGRAALAGQEAAPTRRRHGGHR